MAPGSTRHRANPFCYGKAVLCSNIHQEAFMRIPVEEPKFITEFEVQAYLWNELRKRGINARGEVKTKYDKRAYVRFDIAIFKAGQLTHIVEIKRSKISHKTSWNDTRQGKRYNEFGVPVNIIYGMEGADEFLSVFG
jgi:hypothetical protein